MDAVSPVTRIALPLAPAGAGLLAALTGMAVLAAPTSLLEAFALDSGIAAIVAAAEPPLGLTARLALTVLAAGGVFAAAWVLLDLFGPGRRLNVTLPDRMIRDVREPVRAARDLGMPFLEVKAKAARAAPRAPADVERPLPKDLDLPLSFYDPGAVPAVPADPVPLVPALARPKAEDDAALELTVRAPEPEIAAEPIPPIEEPAPAPVHAAEPATPVEVPLPIKPAAPAERWEVVELPTPPVTRAPARTERPSEATIQALLARLERGMADKATPAAPAPAEPPRQTVAAASWPSLTDTLGELRALAANRG